MYQFFVYFIRTQFKTFTYTAKIKVNERQILCLQCCSLITGGTAQHSRTVLGTPIDLILLCLLFLPNFRMLQFTKHIALRYLGTFYFAYFVLIKIYPRYFLSVKIIWCSILLLLLFIYFYILFGKRY